MKPKTFSLAAVMALIQLTLGPPSGSLEILQQLSQKLAQLDKQIAVSPRTVDLRNSRAIILAQLRRPKDAMKDIQVALGIDPHNVETLISQGSVYSAQQEDDRAIESFTESLKYCKTDAQRASAHFGMYLCSMEQGHYEQALEHIDKCCLLTPQSENNLHFICRGRLFERFGKYQKALKDYDASIKQVPSSLAYRERAKIFTKQGQDQKALDDLTKCISLTNESFDYELRGDSYQALGQYQKAVADYSVALKRNRKHWSAVEQNRANAYEKWRKYDLALADYNELLAQDKDAGLLGYTNAMGYLSGRARIYEALGKHELAEKDRAAAKRIEKENSQGI